MKKRKGTILVVDDNKDILITLNQLLKSEFDQIITIQSPEQIHYKINSNQVDVVLLDMNFKAGINTVNEGLYWLNEIRKIDSNIIVVLITAYGDINVAVRAMKEGADDFITKPWDGEKLLLTLKNYVELSHSKRKIKRLQSSQQDLTVMYPPLIGDSEAMKSVNITIEKIADTDANVLIEGENGTGKALVAYDIHKQSGRRDEAFVHVDLGAINENLFESELFGHVKGAFTDAKEDRVGRFEAASDGTLFLDEIGNLSVQLQQKLLTVLQNKTISRLGSNKLIPLNVRLICATNRNLKQMIADGLFREDLLYRINTIAIEVPALRQRGKDILTLVKHFLVSTCKKYNKNVPQISDKAIDKIMKHSWPGNVRELEHSIERAVLLFSGDDLQVNDLFPSGVTEKQIESTGSNKLEDIERDTILRVLDSCRGNLTKAAKELGISRSTLYLKIEKYGL